MKQCEILKAETDKETAMHLLHTLIFAAGKALIA